MIAWLYAKRYELKIIKKFALFNRNQPMSQQWLGALHRLGVFPAEAVGDAYLKRGARCAGGD